MIDLKPLTTLDLEWVRQLRNKNSQYFFDNKEISVVQQRKWFENYEHRKNYDFFVITKDEVNVGTISVIDKETYRDIGNIVIDEPYRKNGIFKQAMELIEHRYESPFMLEVLSTNLIAIGAYKSLGYKEARIVFYKQ